MKKTLIISLLILAQLAVSCGEAAVSDETTSDGAETTSAAVTEELDPFDDMNFGGQEIRIYTSTNDPGGVGNSNYLIEGPAEETGDIVQDSAYFRNRSVEEILGVRLVYTEYDVNYASAAAEVSKLVMSGDDLYDIIISDLYPMAGLSTQGNFRNIANAPYIDRSKDYWYETSYEKSSPTLRN